MQIGPAVEAGGRAELTGSREVLYTVEYIAHLKSGGGERRAARGRAIERESKMRAFRTMGPVLGLLAALGAGLGELGEGTARAEAPVVIMAAASLTNAMEALVPMVQARVGVPVTVSFAASSALAKQIENDAPADLFLSADLAWMDYLEKRSLIRSDSRVNLLGNELVLIAPLDSPVTLTLAPGVDLGPAFGAALGDGRLAVGDPAHVPVGKYARAALESLGLWASLESRLARTDNVRVGLSLVSRGEAPLGIVYRTDAMVDKGVRVVAAFPAGSYPPVTYPAAITANSHSAAAPAVLAALRTPEAGAVFRSFGFVTLAGENR